MVLVYHRNMANWLVFGMGGGETLNKREYLEIEYSEDDSFAFIASL